MHKMNQGTS